MVNLIGFHYHINNSASLSKQTYLQVAIVCIKGKKFGIAIRNFLFQKVMIAR